MNRPRLSASQRQRLEWALRSHQDVRLYRRILAVLEADRGSSVAQIARLLRVSRQSVHNWLAAYRQRGDPAALADASRSGRPAVCGEEAEGLLEALLAHSPERFGYFAANWTVPLLQEQLQYDLGRAVCDETVRRTLHRLGYGWKRSRYELLPDPEAEKKTAHSPRHRPAAVPQRAAGRG